MNQVKSIFFILPAVILLYAGFSCKNNPQTTNTHHAAYYWKTQFKWSKSDTELCKKLKINRLYIRYFDIKLQSNGEALPNAVIDMGSAPLPDEFETVPVVFILNSVFKKLNSNEELRQLAQKTNTLITQLHQNKILQEVQIDCDWSESTAETYFEFLKYLKLESKCPLSVTLRLWQFKDRKTSGIPPVDRVMLMAYNLQNPADYSVENSILDLSEAEKYLKNQSIYPLDMDLVLPIFTWAVHFRNNTFIDFVRGVDTDALQKIDFLEKITANRFRCTKDTLWQQQYFLKNDVLRCEQVSADSRKVILHLTLPYLAHQDSFFVSLFSFDKFLLERFDGF